MSGQIREVFEGAEPCTKLQTDTTENITFATSLAVGKNFDLLSQSYSEVLTCVF